MGKQRTGKLELTNNTTANAIKTPAEQPAVRTVYFPQCPNELLPSIQTLEDPIAFASYEPMTTKTVAIEELPIENTSILVGPDQQPLTPIQLLQLTRYEGRTSITNLTAEDPKETLNAMKSRAIWAIDVDNLAGFAMTFGEVSVNKKRALVCDQLALDISFPVSGRSRLAFILKSSFESELEKTAYTQIVGTPKADFNTALQEPNRYIAFSKASLFDTHAYSQLVAHDFISTLSTFHENISSGEKLCFGFLSYDPKTFYGPYGQYQEQILTALLEGIKRGLQTYLDAHQEDGSKLGQLVLPAFTTTTAHTQLVEDIKRLANNTCSFNPRDLERSSFIPAIASTVTPVARRTNGIPTKHVVVAQLQELPVGEREAFCAQVSPKMESKVVNFPQAPQSVSTAPPSAAISAPPAPESGASTKPQPQPQPQPKAKAKAKAKTLLIVGNNETKQSNFIS